MVVDLCEKIQAGQEVRQNLIALRSAIKDEKNKRALAYHLAGDYTLAEELLEHEDPKVRKNAALILGELEYDEAVDVLFAAYQKEQTLFVRSSYLQAMMEYNYVDYLPQIKERLEILQNGQWKAEEEKHFREEQQMLREMLFMIHPPKPHKFIGYDQESEVILMTNPAFRKITAQQIKNSGIKVLGTGIMVKTRHLDPILEIRTYKELLFFLNTRSIPAEPDGAAVELAASNLLELLDNLHSQAGTYYFRVELRSRMPVDKRGQFIRKFADSLEKATAGRMVNTASAYEIELRLVQNKEGNLLPLLKLYTLEDKRFKYRREYVSSSIAPTNAAGIVHLAKEYMTEMGQVLDPFCGVGTMLIERNRLVKARTMYGLDIFGEAIEKARVNTEEEGLIINYVNRDYFQFQHEYLFDEIITDMPVRSKNRSREEIDQIYSSFFGKSLEMLKENGIIIMYCNEIGLVKKYMRLYKHYKMEEDFMIDERNHFHVFVIRKN